MKTFIENHMVEILVVICVFLFSGAYAILAGAITLAASVIPVLFVILLVASGLASAFSDKVGRHHDGY